MDLILRTARPGDGAAMAALYAPLIEASTVTFTTDPVDPCAADAKIAEGAPHWMAERAGQVAGFASLRPFRPGPGYAHTFEHTVIVAPEARSLGIGRALMGLVEAEVRRRGGHVLVAGISGENASAMAFHTALGFREVARMPEVGRKFGRWLDLILMQKFLDVPLSVPPNGG